VADKGVSAAKFRTLRRRYADHKENLKVAIEQRTILEDVNLEIKPGETHVSLVQTVRETSLLMAIMGYPQVPDSGWKIVFKGVDITHKS